MRATKKQIENQILRLADLLGVKVGTKKGDLNYDKTDCYGGYQLVKIIDNNGNGNPIQYSRLKATAFSDHLDFTINLLTKLKTK